MRATAPRSAGFILPTALWILAALAALASAFTVYVRQSAPEVVAQSDGLVARAAALAGVELAVGRIASANPRPPAGDFPFRVGQARGEVVFRSETGFIDLNHAPRDALAHLFVYLGAKDAAAGYLADRVIGWRTPVTEGATRDEAALYRAAGRRDLPRLGPFQHVREFALLPGATPDLVARALPFLTVFSGQAEVDQKAAPADVAATRPPFGAKPSPVERLDVTVRLGDGATYRTQAVVVLFEDDREPYRLLAWREDQ